MEQINRRKLTTDEEIIKHNEKWFKLFLIIPKVTTIIFALVCFILGILFATLEEAIFLLIFWGGGFVFCIFNYVFLKLLLSYQILHIYYLRFLMRNGVKVDKDEVIDVDELPKI